jgi:hypothetical protein
MDIGTRTKRYAFITVLILIVLLSLCIAFLTYRYYGFVARGILGIVLLYLLFLGGSFTKNDVSFKTVLSDPQKGKYLIYAFIDPLLAYWATLEIYEMILYLKR